jgi:hypothetical protein
MDAAWNFRNAYNEARKIKVQQDAFCGTVQEANKNGNWAGVDNLALGNIFVFSFFWKVPNKIMLHSRFSRRPAMGVLG